MMAREQLSSEGLRLTRLRDHFEIALLASVKGVHRNGNLALRLPSTSSLAFDGIEAASALFLFDQQQLCCSAGSACNTKSASPSHVLTAMGRSIEEARGTLRFSLGRFTTEREVNQAVMIISEVIGKLRKL
jgi:cysteine desulfurase